MTAPAVQGRQTSVSSTTNSTSFSPTMPASIAAGEVLVAIISSAGGGSISTTSTGWRRYTPTVLNGAFVGATAFFNPNATGGGSDSLTVTNSSSAQYSAVVLRLPAHTFMYAMAALATSTNSDPPPINTLKSRDTLYLVTRSGAGTTVATVAPAGYSNLQTATGGGSGGASTNTAEKSTTATSSEDPGTFTSGSAAWVTATFAFWTGNADPVANWKSTVRSLSSNKICLFVGDSLTAGDYSTNNNYGSNAISASRPAFFAANFSACKASSANFLGDGGIGSYQTSPTGGINGYDNRRSVGSSWTATDVDGTNFFVLGAGAQYGTTNGQTLDFTPGVSFDHYRVRYITYPGSPQATAKVDSGSANSLPQNAADSLSYSDYAASGTTIHITTPGTVSGANAFIWGIETWNSATPQVTVLNAGWGGSTSTDNVSATAWYSPLNGLAAIAPDLSIICLGANDFNPSGANLTEAQYKANMRLIILTALISGEVLLSAPRYGNPSTGLSEADQRAIMEYFIDLAYELGCAYLMLVDQPGWTSYATANANGYMASDGGHCTGTGYSSWSGFERAIVDPGLAVSTVAESASASDTVSSSAVFSVSVSESGAAADGVSAGGMIYMASVSETGTANDNASAAAVFGSAIAETA